MRREGYQAGLHRFAIATALATLALIGVGGLVTSHSAGLSVPDWPTTYGYNMFFFPISLWTGGVFYEHSHRLLASAVGLLSVMLAVWLWLRDSRRNARWLGILAVVLVIAQGVLGGLRVTEMSNALGIVHATLAQLFLVLVSAIALLTSRAWWRRRERPPALDHAPQLRWVYGALTALILIQLMLAASMRHQHAGLAVPDFPLAYGALWPDLSPNAIAQYNQARSEVTAQNPITATHIVLHMLHRLVAVVIGIGMIVVVRSTRRHARPESGLRGWSWAWLALVLVQVLLGAATVWTNKSADIATLHVGFGAATFVLGFSLWLWTGPGGLATSPSPVRTRPMDSLPNARHVPA